MMAIRIFVCDDCGHHMRVGGHYCGACHIPKRWWQMPAVIYGALLGASFALLAVGLSILLAQA